MRARLALPAAGAAIVVASLAVRMAFPIQAFGAAGHDDLLFVRLAENLRKGDWLGGYDSLTLAKGAAFPMFMALNSLTPLPLKFTEHAAYLGACVAFAASAGALFRSWAAGLALLAVLAFNPVFWNADIGGRVVREPLYATLSLALLALGARVFLMDRAVALGDDLKAKRGLLAGFGALGGVFWLTREEGLWLAPSMLVLAAAWGWRRLPRPAAAPPREHYRDVAKFLGFAILGFAAVVGTVNVVNKIHYGVYRNNDFRDGDFAAAYGALARITHENWRRYVVFPADARRKAYAASPAARELAPLFEGERGEFWRRVGCEQTGTQPCAEILSGWFMWAFREAIHAAGYESARAARGFHRRLASEINAACERRDIACGPRSDSLVPPWHDEYLARTWDASVSVYWTLATLGGTAPSVRPSTGPADGLAMFERMTNGPLATGTRAEGVRHRVAAALSRIAVASMPFALPAGLAAWVALAGWSLARRRWHPGHVLVAALAAAIAMRVGLLGFLEATSIPSNNMLYLAPVSPIALAFPACVLFLALAILRPGKALHAAR